MSKQKNKKMKDGNHFVSFSSRRFLANGNDVFYPEPWWAKYRGMSRAEIPRTMSPDLVYITLPMYSLRDIALRTIKLLLLNDNDAYSLDIPKNLQHELATMEPRKNARNNSDDVS
uniref:Uncharacterized protein n=1 Tax=Glypta fumiferanae TaxID=389681 RepID=A0A0F6QA93_9HYME|nr:hypothetical protein [Glypta fumiferanae]